MYNKTNIYLRRAHSPHKRDLVSLHRTAADTQTQLLPFGGYFHPVHDVFIGIHACGEAVRMACPGWDLGFFLGS